ncbi:oligosaccharide flippase family protein, partial [Enterococcus faecium]|nr:oligosaccharide flippase family protein [Enterococcus faecium]
MERVKTLLKNSVIFAIGNFGSRLILLVLVPFYTYYLSTTQYGTVDLITTTVSMLTPIVTLSIYEGTLRFVMDKDADNKIAI